MRPGDCHILLVNPWIHDFAAYDFWARPLGLLSLAALLRRQGAGVSYIDCLDRFHPRAPTSDPTARQGRGPYRKTPLPRPAILADVTRTFSRYGIAPQWLREDLARIPPPQAILVTSLMTYWYTGLRETIAVLREVYPDVPIVLGGVYATLLPAHAVRHSGADRVLPGPGFETVLDLLAELRGETRPSRSAALDDAAPPWPALDLQRTVGFVPLLTSSGCPYRCPYCAVGLLAPHRQRRAAEEVLAEIHHWHRRFGVRDVVFYDDALLAEAETHALPLLEALVRARLPLRLHTPNALHVGQITMELARLLREAGFQTLRLGLEMADDGGSERLDAKVRRGEFQTAMSHLHRAGFGPLEVGAYLLVGLPGQREQDVRLSIAAVHACGATPVLAYYTPIPGTALWQQARASSRYDLEADPLFTNNAVMPCQQAPFDWAPLSRLKQLARRP